MQATPPSPKNLDPFFYGANVVNFPQSKRSKKSHRFQWQRFSRQLQPISEIAVLKFYSMTIFFKLDRYADNLRLPSSGIFHPFLISDSFFFCSSDIGPILRPRAFCLILSLDSSLSLRPIWACPIFRLCSSDLGIKPTSYGKGLMLYPLLTAFNILIHFISSLTICFALVVLSAKQYSKASAPCLSKDLCSSMEWWRPAFNSLLWVVQRLNILMDEPTYTLFDKVLRMKYTPDIIILRILTYTGLSLFVTLFHQSGFGSRCLAECLFCGALHQRSLSASSILQGH